MPDEEEVIQDEATKAKIHEERQKILAHFQALTGQQQEEQREIWTEELSILEDEIAQLKIKLGTKLNRRNHLRLLLGFDMIKKVAKKSVDHLAKEFKELLHNAKTSNEPLQPQPSLQPLLQSSSQPRWTLVRSTSVCSTQSVSLRQGPRVPVLSNVKVKGLQTHFKGQDEETQQTFWPWIFDL